VFECDSNNPFEFIPDCRTQNQNNGLGGYDPFLPTIEEDCK